MRKEHENSPNKEKRQEKEETLRESTLVFEEVAGARPGRNCRVAIFVIATLLERSVPGGLRIQFASCNGRRLATVCLCKSIGAILDKLEDASRVAFNKCPVKGREALLIRGIYTGSPSQEKVHALGEALVCRPHE
jgi:hypothetical protein